MTPCHNYLSGPSNPIADALSHDFDKTWDEVTGYFPPIFPHNPDSQVWTHSYWLLVGRGWAGDGEWAVRSEGVLFFVVGLIMSPTLMNISIK